MTFFRVDYLFQVLFPALMTHFILTTLSHPHQFSFEPADAWHPLRIGSQHINLVLYFFQIFFFCHDCFIHISQLFLISFDPLLLLPLLLVLLLHLLKIQLYTFLVLTSIVIIDFGMAHFLILFDKLASQLSYVKYTLFSIVLSPICLYILTFREWRFCCSLILLC